MLWIFVFGTIFGIFINPIYSELYMKSVKIECTGNPKYVYQNFSCRLKAINRYKTVGIMVVEPRDPLRNISFNFALYMRNGANVFQPVLFNVTENLCKWYNHRSPGAYVTLLMKIFKKFTNINHSCPYTGPIVADNLYYDMAILPLPLPKNLYKFKVIFYEGIFSVMEEIGTVTYYMELIESRH